MYNEMRESKVSFSSQSEESASMKSIDILKSNQRKENGLSKTIQVLKFNLQKNSVDFPDDDELKKLTAKQLA
jgi:flagellar biosynthesis regulator FlaF